MVGGLVGGGVFVWGCLWRWAAQVTKLSKKNRAEKRESIKPLSNMCTVRLRLTHPLAFYSDLGVTRAKTQIELTVLFCHTLELR